jgi:uncharacterized protein
VEYDGDIYPCDFLVEQGWKPGNVNLDSWTEITTPVNRNMQPSNVRWFVTA